MNRYGLYLGYSPNADLKKEGLGRYLIEFLKAAREIPDVRFVVACPSWMRANLTELFEEIGSDPGEIEVISPSRVPLLLRFQQYYAARKKRPRRPGWWGRLSRGLDRAVAALVSRMEKWLVNIRSVSWVVLLGLLLLPFALLAVLWQAAAVLLGALARKAKPLKKGRTLRSYFMPPDKMMDRPAHSATATRLFRLMEEAETDQMARLINSRTDIRAWFCPTAFWPGFNQVTRPRLMCVPDVVMAEFPAAFARSDGSKLLSHFQRVEKAILGGSHFVTYSEGIKRRILVDRYFVPASKVQVVPHGAFRLDELVEVSGFADDREATDQFCRGLFEAALAKAVNYPLAPLFGKGRLKFIFYASQFRPNKNVVGLLRAYEHLLRRRYIGHKLILTGNPKNYADVRRFIAERRLSHDVLCLNGLTAQELAACYRLADLAVNPSLSEGGCPFTLTEALSVGTPVVMGRIPVTEEVILDPGLRDCMLFDPYDWKDMGDKIEWGIKNREVLLGIQKPFYDRLAGRRWVDVVGNYVSILENISAGGAARGN